MHPTAWFWSIGGTAVASLGGGIFAYLRRRYSKSVGKELQPFGSYVGSSLALIAASWMRPRLAGLFGVRPFADVTLTGLTSRMPIPSRGRSEVDIDQAYIRLGLSSSPDRRIADTSLLTAEGSVLIFGEPGSGKSSLTRKLQREGLQQAFLEPYGSRLPFRFEMGRLPWNELPGTSEARVKWMRDLMVEAVARVKRVNRPQFVFQAFAEQSGLMMFLDGLDEVPSDKIESVESFLSEVVQAFLHESPHTLVVVTARTRMRSVLSRSFVDQFGQVLTVTPFTPADVFAFLLRWDFAPERRYADVQRIFEHIQNHVTLADMCTNPLVLAMYVAEDERHTGTTGSAVRLADTRAKFYDEVVSELLYFRREDQQAQERSANTQVLFDRQELLGRIALDHLAESDDPANLVSLDRATRIAQDYWGTDQPRQAATRLTELAVGTGLVTVQVRDVSLQFIHLSIAEYLAGKELSERSHKQLRKVLSRAARDPIAGRRLWETVIFAVSLSNRDVRDQALEQLIDERAPAELIMRMVREVRAYDRPAFAQALDAAGVGLSGRAAADWDEEWLDQLRLLASCLRDAHLVAERPAPASVPTVAEWLGRLIGTDGERFDRVFGLYLTVSTSEALRLADEFGVQGRLLADRERMISALEHPDVVVLALRRIAADPAGSVAWIDLLAEAALRFALVTQMLMDEKHVPRQLAVMADRVSRQHAWHRFGPAAGTFYGAVLAVGADRAWPARPEEEPRLAGRVDILAQVTAGHGKLRVPDVTALVMRHAMGATDVRMALSILEIAKEASFSRQAVNKLLNLDPSIPIRRWIIVATRFSDGVVRLYVDGASEMLIPHLRSARIQRAILARRSYMCGADGRELLEGLNFSVSYLVDHSPLQQASALSEHPGTLWCVPLPRPRGFRMFPPRKARALPEAPINGGHDRGEVRAEGGGTA
ncbi:NACHT domain-containing protein [Actinoplanes sp. NPDC051411]|uniref:NACHT domain-containing protein n=1 Tax=Actinoplanes sp. NPDC051411 TaxID=3155522 RepID=UPI00343D0EFA